MTVGAGTAIPSWAVYLETGEMQESVDGPLGSIAFDDFAVAVMVVGAPGDQVSSVFITAEGPLCHEFGVFDSSLAFSQAHPSTPGIVQALQGVQEDGTALYITNLSDGFGAGVELLGRSTLPGEALIFSRHSP